MSTTHPTSAKQVTLVVEGGLVCLAEFALGEYVLAFPNHVLRLTSDSPQKNSFHNFHRD